MTPKFATLAALLLAARCLVYISQGLFDSSALQRDLRTYQVAAKVFQRGADPYNLPTLVRYSGDSSMLRYVYPPQTLWAFRALCYVPLDNLRYGYFFLQIAALGVLLWIWKTHFLPHPYGLPLLILFAVFAFRGGLSVDLTSGNITLLNNCLLWLGFAAYLNRRYSAFAILVLLGSLFKNVEILFLGLLLMDRRREAYQWFALSVTCFMAYHLIGYLVYPEFYNEWLHNVSTNPEWGAYNPAALPFIEGIVFAACRLIGYHHPWGFAGYAAYLLYALALPVISWHALRKCDLLRDRTLLLMFALFGFAILLPRFKDYSYILLILPSAWIILQRLPTWRYQLVAILVVLVPLFAYQPLIVAMLMFTYVMITLRREDRRGGALRAASVS